MEINYQILILKILEAINYTDDKEKFVENFVTNTLLQTFVTLAESLPIEKQKRFIKESANAQDNQEKATHLLKEYFTDEQIQKTFHATGINEINGLLESVKDTLSDEQKQKVITLINQISSSDQPSENPVNV